MAGTIVADTIQNGAGSSTSMDNAINGSAKAWGVWDSNSGTVSKSYNVSSVTRTGTGQYTVAYTNALPSANQLVLANTVGSFRTGVANCNSASTTGCTLTLCAFNTSSPFYYDNAGVNYVFAAFVN